MCKTGLLGMVAQGNTLSGVGLSGVGHGIRFFKIFVLAYYFFFRG